MAWPADLSLMVEAEPESVRAALQQLMRDLGPANLAEDLQGTLELILAEVLNNIVEHAYADKGGGISLHLGLHPMALWCEVSDQGAPMPDGALPAGDAAALDDLPEGGFGWFLIRSLANDLSYRRDGETNRLCFSLSLAPPPVGA